MEAVGADRLWLAVVLAASLAVLLIAWKRGIRASGSGRTRANHS
jgi:hypothetical protein